MITQIEIAFLRTSVSVAQIDKKYFPLRYFASF